MVIDRTAKPLTLRDKVNLGAFALAVSGLIVLMAVVFLAPMFAALDMFYVVGLVLLAVHTVPLLRQGHWSLEQFVVPLRRFLDFYIEMITDIALLLATLGIMTGALVITGVPVKLGMLLSKPAASILSRWSEWASSSVSSWVAACPPRRPISWSRSSSLRHSSRLASTPGVVHFFAFFLGVFGELTPPTSITAAITSKIAGVSFYQTLFRSMQICVALFTLMIGIFIHPDIVVKPGLDQLGSSLLIGIATIGISFSLQATFFDQGLVDRSVRVVLAVFALSVLVIPKILISSACAAPVVIAIAYWLGVRRRKLETNGDGVAEISAASLAPSAVVDRKAAAERDAARGVDFRDPGGDWAESAVDRPRARLPDIGPHHRLCHGRIAVTLREDTATTPSAAELIARARSFIPMLIEATAETDRGGRVPHRIVDEMREAGLFLRAAAEALGRLRDGCRHLLRDRDRARRGRHVGGVDLRRRRRHAMGAGAARRSRGAGRVGEGFRARWSGCRSHRPAS